MESQLRTKHSMEPTINSFSGRIVGSNNAQALSSLTTCSGQKDGLALNHPSFVIAVVGDDGAVPKEGNPFRRRGEGNASLPQKTEDAPPSILVFACEDIIEDVLQCLPLKARGSAIAESLIDRRKGFCEGGGAEAIGQLEQHGSVGVDDGHDKPLSAPFSRETLLYLLLRLMEQSQLFILVDSLGRVEEVSEQRV